MVKKIKKKNISLDVLVMNAGTIDRSFFLNQKKKKLKISLVLI